MTGFPATARQRAGAGGTEAEENTRRRKLGTPLRAETTDGPPPAQLGTTERAQLGNPLGREAA